MTKANIDNARTNNNQCADKTRKDRHPSPHPYRFTKHKGGSDRGEKWGKKAKRGLLTNGDQGHRIKPGPHCYHAGN